MNDSLDNENHVALGLRRIGHQYGQSEKFRQFVTATLQPLNDLEAAFLSLLNIDLDTAEGVVLELLGRIVGAPAIIENALPLPHFGFDGQQSALPFGETDDLAVGGYWLESGETGSSNLIIRDPEEYRRIIQLQILRNYSDCTPDEVIKVINLITDTPFIYVDGPMWIGLGLSDTGLTQLERRMIELFLPRPSGVGLRFLNGWIGGFGFADQPDSAGFGETDNPAAGGYWVREFNDGN